jgi:hypothetical protein
MRDPTNQLPVDPEWLHLVDQLNKQAARQLGCMVLTIAVQENGKMMVAFDGVPDTGDLAEMAKNVPALLLNLAVIAQYQDDIVKKEPQQ